MFVSDRAVEDLEIGRKLPQRPADTAKYHHRLPRWPAAILTAHQMMMHVYEPREQPDRATKRQPVSINPALCGRCCAATPGPQDSPFATGWKLRRAGGGRGAR
jgi:hypothetical protein